ncbi:hypothetical protein KJ865_15830, partial [Myxococcota bacterium]|nr:hypothetical protein [Myxococcota bacterium]
MKRLLFIFLLLSLSNCDDDSSTQNNNNNNIQEVPVRTDCAVTIEYPAGSENGAKVVGSFNDWSIESGVVLLRDGYRWLGRLTSNAHENGAASVLPPGEHHYKIVLNDTDWFNDSGNPYSIFDESQQNENSLLILPDCDTPYLEELQTDVQFAQGSLSLAVQVFRAGDGEQIQNVELLVFKGEELVDAQLDYNEHSGMAVATGTGLSHGKYRFSFTATDVMGRMFHRTFPVWFEQESLNW